MADQFEVLDSVLDRDIWAETYVDLIENDMWNWFENRNGSRTKLRKMHMWIHQRGKMPLPMFSISFLGKAGYWLRGGFWISWEDIYKGFAKLLDQLGYEIVKKEES